MAEQNDFKELAAALAKAQGEIEGAKKRASNPAFRSRYADLASVWDACREELSSNGLSVMQLMYDAEPGRVGVETILIHSSGQSISSRYSMPVKNPLSAQDVGSAITYARRYALMALVGIAPEDDDGNAASGTKTKPQAQPKVDWEAESASLVAEFTAASADDRRSMYANVRRSAMPDDMKTKLLLELELIVKADKQKG